MKDERTRAYVAQFLAGYLMRWMEGNVYDKAFETDVGKQLKDLSPQSKYGIEAALNALAAFLEVRTEGGGALQGAFRRVGADAAPELAKRLINHTEASTGQNPADVLLQLAPDAVESLLDWFERTPEDRRTSLLAEVTTLRPDALQRLAQLTPDTRDRLFALSQQPRPTSTEPTKPVAAETVHELRRMLTVRRERKRRRDDS